MYKEDKKDMDKGVGDNSAEDRYWEIEKERHEQSKKINRIEQARRNVEALNRYMPFIYDREMKEGKELMKSLMSNVKIMDEVTKL